MGVIVNYTQIDWTENAGAKGNAKGQVSFSVLDQVLYIGVGDSVVAFQPTQNAFSGDYDDLDNLPNLSQYATNASVTAAFNGLPDFSQFLTEVAISDVDGLQAALDSKADSSQIGWELDQTISSGSWAIGSGVQMITNWNKIPSPLYITLVCETPNNGYSVGDEAQTQLVFGSSFFGMLYYCDPNEIGIKIQGAVYVASKSSQAIVGINPSQWGIRVRARRD